MIIPSPVHKLMKCATFFSRVSHNNLRLTRDLQDHSAVCSGVESSNAGMGLSTYCCSPKGSLTLPCVGGATTSSVRGLLGSGCGQPLGANPHDVFVRLHDGLSPHFAKMGRDAVYRPLADGAFRFRLLDISFALSQRGVYSIFSTFLRI